MENSSINNSAIITNFTDELGDDDRLLKGVLAFAPIIAIELLVAVISNTILLALVILACVHKHNNNINIYLFSLSIAGFMGAFSLFCLFTLIVSQRWVLGSAMCVLNWFMTNLTNLVYLVLYLIISRDKYKVVKGNSRPDKKRAYVRSAIVWTVLVVSTLSGLWHVADELFNPLDNEHFVCYQLKQDSSRNNIKFIFRTISLIGFWLLSTIIILISFFTFLLILLKLRNLKCNQRIRFSNSEQSQTSVRIDERDYSRPQKFNATGEEGTAKSLAFIYFIYFFSVFVSYVMGYANILRNYILFDEDHQDPKFEIYFTVLLIILLFPTTNPLYLILSNKRLRNRVKGLFKCELKPYLGDSPVHTTVPLRNVHKKTAKPKNKVGSPPKIQRLHTKISPMPEEQ